VVAAGFVVVGFVVVGFVVVGFVVVDARLDACVADLLHDTASRLAARATALARISPWFPIAPERTGRVGPVC
jgi:hypothetical protein